MTRKALFGIICGLVLAAVSLSSCAPAGYISKEAEFNNAWVGKTHQEIVAAYGAPTREVTDGKDGTILVYEEFSTSVYGPAYPYRHYPWGGWYGHDVYTRTNRDYADFFINGALGQDVLDDNCLVLLPLAPEPGVGLLVQFQAPRQAKPDQCAAARLEVQAVPGGGGMDRRNGNLPGVPVRDVP